MRTVADASWRRGSQPQAEHPRPSSPVSCQGESSAGFCLSGSQSLGSQPPHHMSEPPALVDDGREARGRTALLATGALGPEPRSAGPACCQHQSFHSGSPEPPAGQHAGHSGHRRPLTEARRLPGSGPLPPAPCYSPGTRWPFPRATPSLTCWVGYGLSQDAGRLGRTRSMWAFARCSVSLRDRAQPRLEGPKAGLTASAGKVTSCWPLCLTILQATVSLRAQPPGAIRQTNYQLPGHSI